MCEMSLFLFTHHFYITNYHIEFSIKESNGNKIEAKMHDIMPQLSFQLCFDDL